MTKKKILIATGGTGGHVIPAYSLANFLMNNDYDVTVTSDYRGLNFINKYKNLNMKILPTSPLIKKNFIKLLVSISVILFSIIKSFFILLFNRPLVVFGMGGYSSFPICIAASILRIKIVIYENNLIIGKANKYLLPFAKKIFVSYKELDGISKEYQNKVYEIGNILREEIINSKLELEKKKQFESLKILVLGGSQAAKIFADELPPIFKKLNNSKIAIKVYQQCQKEQNEQISQFYQKAQIDYELFNFTDKIIDYYFKANLVITRSGASVLGELINIKIPFIAVPLPTSADNHQYKNAVFYKKKGYGYLLNEKDIKNKLFDLIYNIYKDQSFLKILSNQSQYSDKNIFSKLNIELKKIINEKN